MQNFVAIGYCPSVRRSVYPFTCFLWTVVAFLTGNASKVFFFYCFVSNICVSFIVNMFSQNFILEIVRTNLKCPKANVSFNSEKCRFIYIKYIWVYYRLSMSIMNVKLMLIRGFIRFIVWTWVWWRLHTRNCMKMSMSMSVCISINKKFNIRVL